jgi:nucleoside-diphosphate-sugar epimerase
VSRTVAVTGANGFIGRHLVAHLAARGDAVRAIVRASSAVDDLPAGVSIVRATLAASALTDAFHGADAVVHLAGIVSTVRVREYHEVNVDGTRAVAIAAQAAGAHLVDISSLAAAGPAPASSPRSEADPAAPINDYGRSKLEGERAIAAIPGLRWTVLRPGIVYGPGDRALRPLFDLARRGVLPLVGRPGAAYSMVHVSDLVTAIAAAIDRAPGGETMFVAHAVPVTTRALIEGVRDAAGSRAALLPIPMAFTRLLAVGGDAVGWMSGRPQAMNTRRYDEMAAVGFACRVDRLRDRLGVVARIDLTEGLADTAAWIRTARRR